MEDPNSNIPWACLAANSKNYDHRFNQFEEMVQKINFDLSLTWVNDSMEVDEYLFFKVKSLEQVSLAEYSSE